MVVTTLASVYIDGQPHQLLHEADADRMVKNVLSKKNSTKKSNGKLHQKEYKKMPNMIRVTPLTKRPN